MRDEEILRMADAIRERERAEREAAWQEKMLAVFEELDRRRAEFCNRIGITKDQFDAVSAYLDEEVPHV